MMYHFDCQNCPHSGDYFFPTQSETRIIKCPGCHRGTLATKITDKNTTLVEKDGLVGVFKAPTEAPHARRRRI